MNAELFVDPACPWTWNTYRWLAEVREQRSMVLRLRPFSLLLDDTLADLPLARRLELASSTRALRVMEAARHRYGDAPIGELYTRLGTGFHHDEHRAFEHVELAIIDMGLDIDLLSALDDPRWDGVIFESMRSAHELAGDDAGVPLLVMHQDGPSRAFLGPVFSPAPTGLAAITAWDAMVALIAAPGFFELKRHRDAAPILPARPRIEGAGVIDLTAT